MNNNLDLTQKISSYAKENPKRIALRDSERELTYDELDSLIIQVGKKLIRLSFASNERRIYCLFDNSVNAAVVMLACFRFGLTYVPLSTRVSPEVLKRQLSLCSPGLIVVDRKVFDSSAALELAIKHWQIQNEELVFLDHLFREELSSADWDVTQDPLKDEDDAYILFTSGSSGESKGVVISYGNINAFVGAVLRLHTFSFTDEFLSFSRLVFDLSMFDHLIPFQVGAGLHIITRDSDYLNPVPFMERNQITVALLVPSVSNLIAEMYAKKARPELRIRKLFFCGEKLLMSQVKTWRNLKAEIEIFNWYGPTEATVACMEHRVGLSDAEEVELGHAFPGMEIEFASSNGSELVLIGQQVSTKGYLNDISQAFSGSKNRRAYLSGDIVTVDEGRFFWAGRKDNLIKRNGFRISLDYIEKQASSHFVVPSVVLWDDKRSKIYLVLQHPDENYHLKLLKGFQEQVPYYMNPDAVFVFERFPLNERGKIDRKAILKKIASLSTVSGA